VTALRRLPGPAAPDEEEARLEVHVIPPEGQELALPEARPHGGGEQRPPPGVQRIQNPWNFLDPEKVPDQSTRHGALGNRGNWIAPCPAADSDGGVEGPGEEGAEVVCALGAEALFRLGIEKRLNVNRLAGGEGKLRQGSSQ